MSSIPQSETADLIRDVFSPIFERMKQPTEILDVADHDPVFVVSIVPLTVDPDPLCQRLIQALWRERHIAAGVTHSNLSGGKVQELRVSVQR
jgi:hypothetical protein